MGSRESCSAVDISALCNRCWSVMLAAPSRDFLPTPSSTSKSSNPSSVIPSRRRFTPAAGNFCSGAITLREDFSLPSLLSLVSAFKSPPSPSLSPSSLLENGMELESESLDEYGMELEPSEPFPSVSLLCRLGQIFSLAIISFSFSFLVKVANCSATTSVMGGGASGVDFVFFLFFFACFAATAAAAAAAAASSARGS